MNLQKLALKLKGYDVDAAMVGLKKDLAISQDEFQAWLEQRKWAQVKHFYANNAFYRDMVGSTLPDRWEDLPILTKKDYQRPIEELISTGFNKKNIYLANTSGSSGHPFFFAKDKPTHARAWAYVIHRYHSELGIPEDGIEARFYGIPKNPISYYTEKLKDFLFGRERFPVFDLSDETLEVFLNRFKNKPYGYVYGYTNSLTTFCEYLIRKNVVLKDVCPSIKAVIVTSELCTSYHRQIIEKGTGLQVYSEYGASEFAYIGAELSAERWKIIEENVFVESMPVEGLDFDSVGGELVVTDLFNQAFPFIRYSIGDIGKLEKGENGRTLLTGLSGRTNDTAILSSGKRAPGLTFYYVSRSILETSGVFKEFVIRQTELDTFVFEFISDRDLNEKEENEIKKQIEIYLESGLKLKFNRVSHISRPVNGKLKHFYSELKK